MGLDFGLPHHIEPDAEIGTQVEFLRGQRKGPREVSDFSTYPLFVALLTRATSTGRARAGPDDRPTLEEHLAIASDNYLDARRTVMLLSVLVVPATFLLARRFLGAGWSLYAAAVVATSLLGVTFAQQARAHAATPLLILATVLLCMRLRARGTAASYAAAGLAAGLAIGSLQSAVVVLAPVLVAHLLRRERRLFDPRALIPVALVAACFVACYPFLFFTMYGQPPDLPVLSGKSLDMGGNHAIDISWFDGTGFRRVFRTLWRYEPVLSLLLVLGLGTWLAARRRAAPRDPESRADLLVVLAYVVPYLLIIGVFRETYERFVLPLIPFLACFAAWAGARLSARLKAPRLVAGAFALALLFPLATSLRLVWVRAQPDTLELASAWIGEHFEADSGTIFLAPVPSASRGDSSMELPLMRTPETPRQRGVPLEVIYDIWIKYQVRLPDGVSPEPLYTLRWLTWRTDLDAMELGTRRDFIEANPMLYFENTGPGDLIVLEPYELREGQRSLVALTKAMRKVGTRLARFSPDGARWDTGFPFEPQDRDEDLGRWPHYALRCLTVRRTGPVVEIYRLDPERAGG